MHESLIGLMRFRRPLLITAAALVGGGILTWIVLAVLFENLSEVFSNPAEPPAEVSEEKVIAPETFERSLDGVIVDDAGQVNPVPIGVMIENLGISAVRPQWGLSEASVVYSTIAEGGITRYLAIFIDTNVSQIGPVRSARPYYVDFNDENDAVYVNAGGSPEALSAIEALGTKNVNALRSGPYFWRGPGSAPHNLFTSWELLQRALRDKGFAETAPSFEKWMFEDESPLESRPQNADAVTLKIDWASGSLYDVKYAYDRGSNSYKRFQSDEPHLDRNTNEQIAAKNVLVQFVPAEGYYASGKGRVDLDITGEGKGYVVKNGVVTPATWKKAERESRLRFYDADGKEIPLVRGKTWVEVVPGERDVLQEKPTATP